MQQPIKLDLVPGLRAHSGPADVDDGADESKFDDVQALQEEPITVTFILADDSTISKEFKKGHTVAVLKAFLSDECDLDVDTTTLSLSGRTMLDPFSLTDFESVVDASAIEVVVLQQQHPHPRKLRERWHFAVVVAQAAPFGLRSLKTMPYQVLPGLVVISAAFTLMGVGFGAINKRVARKEHQSKLQLLTDWDRFMDERERKLVARQKAAA